MHSIGHKSTKRILFILFDLLVLFIIIGLCFKELARLNQYDSHLLDSRITAEIHKADGSILREKNNHILKIENGDIGFFFH